MFLLFHLPCNSLSKCVTKFNFSAVHCIFSYSWKLPNLDILAPGSLLRGVGYGFASLGSCLKNEFLRLPLSCLVCSWITIFSEVLLVDLKAHFLGLSLMHTLIEIVYNNMYFTFKRIPLSCSNICCQNKILCVTSNNLG